MTIETVIASPGLTLNKAAVSKFAPTYTSFDLSIRSSWKSFTLQFKITNENATAPIGEKLTIYYSTSAFNTTSTSDLAPLVCSEEVTLTGAANGVTYADTPIIPTNGSILYIWFAHDTWTITRSIECTAIGYSPTTVPDPGPQPMVINPIVYAGNNATIEFSYQAVPGISSYDAAMTVDGAPSWTNDIDDKSLTSYYLWIPDFYTADGSPHTIVFTVSCATRTAATRTILVPPDPQLNASITEPGTAELYWSVAPGATGIILLANGVEITDHNYTSGAYLFIGDPGHYTFNAITVFPSPKDPAKNYEGQSTVSAAEATIY